LKYLRGKNTAQISIIVRVNEMNVLVNTKELNKVKTQLMDAKSQFGSSESTLNAFMFEIDKVIGALQRLSEGIIIQDEDITDLLIAIGIAEEYATEAHRRTLCRLGNKLDEVKSGTNAEGVN